MEKLEKLIELINSGEFAEAERNVLDVEKEIRGILTELADVNTEASREFYLEKGAHITASIIGAGSLLRSASQILFALEVGPRNVARGLEDELIKLDTLLELTRRALMRLLSDVSKSGQLMGDAA